MAFCTACGKENAEDTRFCTECGASVGQGEAATATLSNTPPAQPSQLQPTFRQANPQQPMYQTPSQPFMANPAGMGGMPLTGSNDQYAVMSVKNYFWTLLLFAVPIVGIVMCIVYACGGTRNQNKRNLARATLIFFAISLVLSIILFVAFQFLTDWFMNMFNGIFGNELNQFNDLLNQLQKENLLDNGGLPTDLNLNEILPQ